jgi:transcriptional regulator with XRE-family HTH domain
MFRERRGMTQEELAIRSGVARATIGNLESGVRSGLQIENALKLADALGVSLDLLVRGDVLDSETTPALA